jgi:hypothetical protein
LGDRVVGNDHSGPDGVIEFLLGDQAPGIHREVFKDLEGLRPQVKILISHAQTAAREIKRKPVEIQDARNCDVQHSASFHQDHRSIKIFDLNIQKSFIAQSGPDRNYVGYTLGSTELWARQKLASTDEGSPLGLERRRHAPGPQ